MKRRAFIVAALLGLSGMAFQSLLSQDEEAITGELTAIFNFKMVNDQVWTGGQPTVEHLSTMKEEGINAIINIRLDGEGDGPGATYDERLEALQVRELGMDYFNIPVRYSAPQPEDADEFLRITDDQLGEGRVFIHCAAAIRVGAFWMIRRVLRDGWNFDDALEEARQIGLSNQQHLIDFAEDYIEANTR